MAKNPSDAKQMNAASVMVAGGMVVRIAVVGLIVADVLKRGKVDPLANVGTAREVGIVLEGGVVLVVV